MRDREGLTWRKSSHSGSQGDDCVEVASGAWEVHIRDSKCRSLPWIAASPDTWAAFLAGEWFPGRRPLR